MVPNGALLYKPDQDTLCWSQGVYNTSFTVSSFLQESIVNDKIQSVLSRVEEFKHQLDHVSSNIYLYIMHRIRDMHYKLPFFCVICINICAN